MAKSFWVYVVQVTPLRLLSDMRPLRLHGAAYQPLLVFRGAGALAALTAQYIVEIQEHDSAPWRPDGVFTRANAWKRVRMAEFDSARACHHGHEEMPNRRGKVGVSRARSLIAQGRANERIVKVSKPA